MSAPPKTVLTATPEEEAAIREAVRTADPETLAPKRAIAGPEHVDDLLELLADPEVSGAIYDLPRPLTRENVAAWVADFAGQRARGEGLLIVVPDFGKGIVSYSQITVWPERASAELAGAMRSDIQGGGGGSEGAARSFAWMFGTLKVRLIGLTAAPDNVRSIKLIDRAGFVRMGERESMRSDGTVRLNPKWRALRFSHSFTPGRLMSRSTAWPLWWFEYPGRAARLPPVIASIARSSCLRGEVMEPTITRVKRSPVMPAAMTIHFDRLTALSASARAASLFATACVSSSDTRAPSCSSTRRICSCPLATSELPTTR